MAPDALLPLLLVGALGAMLGGALVAWRLRRRLALMLADQHAQLDAARRDAAEQAASRERERLYHDLHDDLGARLLTLIHRAPDAAYADAARAALQDLRDVVSRSRGAAGTLVEVLGEIEAEARQRLAAAGIALHWQAPADLPELALPGERALHLYRIVREAISNAIHHAQARGLRVRVRLLAEEELAIELTDDGSGAAVAASADGGMAAMRARAEQLHGAIRWTHGTAGGSKLLLTVPLR
jgi:signal transduction histidine kinase